MRADALFLGLLLVAPENALGSSSYAGTHHFEDAEEYLVNLGIPRGLPQLEMKYKVGGWGRKLRVEGSATVVKDPSGLKGAPIIRWEGNKDDRDIKLKYMLLMIDPDLPTRDAASDGAHPGASGPVLHWLGLNCVDGAESCYQAIPYMAPSPAKGSGRHRYIFVLFQQTKPPPSMEWVSQFLQVSTREKWDLAGFLDAMKDCMEPLAINFFYATVDEGSPESEEPLHMKPPADGDGSGQSGLGPRWDPAARPDHDEL